MSTDTEPQKTNTIGLRAAHFWLSTAPFFEATLLSACPASAGYSPAAMVTSTLRFYDADGQLVNEAQFEMPPGGVSVLELDSLLGACKFESGFKHSHLEVLSPENVVHQCRIHTRQGAAFLGELVPIFGTRRASSPVTFAASRSPYLALVNLSQEEAMVRCRLFCGGRSPEAVWVLSPGASRLIDLSVEFSEYFDHDAQTPISAHVRLSVKGDYTVGAQVIQKSVGPNDGFVFSGLS